MYPSSVAVAARSAPPVVSVSLSRAIVARIAVNPTAGTTGPWFAPYAWADNGLWCVTWGAVARIDTRANRIVASIKVGDPLRDPNQSDPWEVVTGNGQVWATDRADRAVVRIDPARNRIVQTIPIGIEPFGIAIVGHTLWATGGRDDRVGERDVVVRVDLGTGKEVGVVHLGKTLWLQMAATPAAVWLLSFDPAKVLRLDPVRDKVVTSISATAFPESAAAGYGALWVADQSLTALDRIDLRTNRVVARIRFPHYREYFFPGFENAAPEVVAGDGAVWAIADQSTLLRIDPRTNKPTAALTFGWPVSGLAWGAGSVWVAPYFTTKPLGKMVRVDPRAMPGR
jgi:streptogramin lyase